MGLAFARLGWRTLRRDLRAGELRLLILAVLLAVGALTAVGFLADRLQSGLQRDAHQLLGGDAVIASDSPTPAPFVERARSLGLQVATTLAFPTMARATDAQGGASHLVALKAVGPGYPLRGSLTVAARPGATGQATRAIPALGQVWVDASLLDALDLKVGDPLLLGDAKLAIARIIVIEPDRGAGFLNFAPRVMINDADLAATGLVQPASRVGYRFAVAGPEGPVERFVRWARAQLRDPADPLLRGVRLESPDSGRPAMQQTLDRAQNFLNLVALLAALMSAMAVALAARGFAAAHLDGCAMLRVLGQSQRTLAASYAFEFLLCGLVASGLGVLLGYLVQLGIVQLLSGLIEVALPAPGLRPVVLGLGMGFTLMLAFGLPPVLQLASVPPLRVMRRDLGGLKPASVGTLALGVAGFAALLLVASRDLKLGLIAVGGFAAAVLLFGLLGWLAVRLLRRGVNDATAPRWLVLATRQISARPAYTVVQVGALAVGLLALVLLVLLRTDLIAGWRRVTPPDAPNRFVINVLPEQGAAFRRALHAGGAESFDWYPMIRGRLIAVNGSSVGPANYTDDRAKRLVDREFNLSYSAERPPSNRIVAGRWTPDERGAISIEQGIVDTLGLHLDDTLRFDVAGRQVDARITSLRKVDWGSMHANFFAMFPVGAMPDLPTTFLAAFRAPATPGFDNALVRQFPNITVVDLTSTIAELQRVLDQVIRAVEFLFVFALAAGLVVLLAALGATREERARDFAIMRAVGARAGLLRQVQRAELAGVGLLAGVLASLAAVAIGWALARYVFGFEWSPSPWVPIAGALAGAVLALAAGWWGLREVLRRPVVETLREAAD